MTWENKPVWTEGMFLRPQHFQQFERFVGAQLAQRTGMLRAFGWGFDDLQIDEGQLKTGKLSVLRARGVFDDGTPFNAPGETVTPPVLDVTRDLRDTAIHLCLPVSRAGSADVALDRAARVETRFVAEEFEAADTVYGESARAPLNVGRLQLQLRAEGELEGFSSIPLARVVERRADDTVVLDPEFIPTVSGHRASPTLTGYLSELEGIIHQRAEAIAGRMGTSGGQAGVDVNDVLMLMVMNRLEAAIKQLAAIPAVHPADLYQFLVEGAGELATIAHVSHRPEFMPLYDHRAIAACFGPLMRHLRTALSMGTVGRVVKIDLEERAFGVRVGVIHDSSLLKGAAFVLAARAAVDVETIRANLPRRIKIGSTDQIADLVNRALQGVDLYPMAAEPRQIPYRANTVYFAINVRAEQWRHVQASRSVAVHVAGEIPGLELELWALRDSAA